MTIQRCPQCLGQGVMIRLRLPRPLADRAPNWKPLDDLSVSCEQCGGGGLVFTAPVPVERPRYRQSRLSLVLVLALLSWASVFGVARFALWLVGR